MHHYFLVKSHDARPYGRDGCHTTLVCLAVNILVVGMALGCFRCTNTACVAQSSVEQYIGRFGPISVEGGCIACIGPILIVGDGAENWTIKVSKRPQACR